jgi:diguanylate cyclase (GGDEF)-like protein
VSRAFTLRHRGLGYAALGAVFVLLVPLGLLNATSNAALTLAAVATPIAVFIGIKRYNPVPAWPWWMILIALVMWAVSGVLRATTHQLGNLTATRSFLPDIFALPPYVLLASAYFGFVRARTKAFQYRLRIVYDALIAGLALLACGWVYVIEPLLSTSHSPDTVKLSVILYPCLSLVLIVMVFQVAFGTAHDRTVSERFLLASMCAMFCGDTLYTLAEIHVLNGTDNALNVPYLFTYVAALGCVLHPSMRGLTEASVRTPTAWSPIRILLVSVALTVPPLLIFESSRDSFDERVGLFVLCLSLTGMAILQIVQALRSIDRSEARLMHSALHDNLTGLANRTLLEEHLNEALNRAARTGARVGVVYIDIDKLRFLNDTLGQAIGDATLIEVGRRLTILSRPSEIAARIAADEFALVLAELPDESSAAQRAHRIRDALRQPFEIAEQELTITVSIGLAVASGEDAVDAEVLIRDGAAAMYRAKETGRDAVAVFDDKMRARVAEQVEIARDLRYAVRRGQLHLAYQPVVDMHRGIAVGVEALVRWDHPTLGLLMPGSFIKVAEESDDILEIGTWVLEEALTQVAQFRKQSGMEEFTVAVNLSALQLRDQLLVQRVSRAIAASGLPGSAVTLELTESEMLRDFEAASSSFQALRRLGVKLAVDDFGTEYSSLANLQQLPVDILKIDKSFVDGICNPETSDRSLVAAMLALASALGVETIAEGVETEDQAQELRELGCTNAQGYLYARPVRAAKLFETVHELIDASAAYSQSGSSQQKKIGLG